MPSVPASREGWRVVVWEWRDSAGMSVSVGSRRFKEIGGQRDGEANQSALGGGETKVQTWCPGATGGETHLGRKTCAQKMLHRRAESGRVNVSSRTVFAEPQPLGSCVS